MSFKISYENDGFQGVNTSKKIIQFSRFNLKNDLGTLSFRDLVGQDVTAQLTYTQYDDFYTGQLKLTPSQEEVQGNFDRKKQRKLTHPGATINVNLPADVVDTLESNIGQYKERCNGFLGHLYIWLGLEFEFKPGEVERIPKLRELKTSRERYPLKIKIAYVGKSSSSMVYGLEPIDLTKGDLPGTLGRIRGKTDIILVVPEDSLPKLIFSYNHPDERIEDQLIMQKPLRLENINAQNLRSLKKGQTLEVLL